MSVKPKKLCWVKPSPEAVSEGPGQVPSKKNTVFNKYMEQIPKKNDMFQNSLTCVETNTMNSKHFDDSVSRTSGEKDDKKEASLKNFANQTSAHGIKNILSGSRVRRVSWFVAVIAAMIVLTYNLVTILVDFRSYPYQTVFTLTPKSEITFPAVTICPLNQLDSNKVPYPDEVESVLHLFHEGPFKRNGSIDDIKDIEPYKTILNWTYWDLMKDATPTIQQTFVKCQWQKADIDCSQYMTYINTPTGRCFQFNVNEENALKALRPGSRGGFSAVLRLDQDGYSVSERHSAGFKLLLHDQYDYPDVFSRGQFFGPGFSYDVSFRKEQFKFLAEPYKAYESSFCKDEFPADYTGSTKAYSMKSCIHHQDGILTSQSCGCLEEECSVYEYLSCYKPLFQEYYDNVTTIENVFDCAFACNFPGFLVAVSSVYYPSNEALTFISKTINQSEDTFRQSILELNVYFEDLLVRESIHVPVYGNWFNIMAMLGGNMGLFLGASLLTIGELIEVFMLMWILLAAKIQCLGKSKVDETESD